MERIGATLKHIFWPHHANQYQPALIRVRGLLVVLGAVLVFGNFSPLAKPNGGINLLGYATDVTIAGLLEETNQARNTAGLGHFQLSPELNKAAANKAKHMVDNNYWSHEAPDGTTPWSFIDAVGYTYLKAGENLAYGFASSSGAVDGWMNSQGHRANILDKDFEEVGFGIRDGASYQGDENTVIVAFYAKPYVPSEIQLIEEEVQPAEAEPTPEIAEPEKPIIEEESSSDITTTTDVELYPISPEQAVLDEGIAAKVISVYQALVSGEAPLSMYLTVGILMMVGLVYAFRHVRIVHRFIVVGEHTLSGHPLLEASIIYALIWLVLTATYGVII